MHKYTFTDDSLMQRPIPKQELQLECAAHFDPESVTYSVNATWDLTNQHSLVLEALLAHKFLVVGSTIMIEVCPDPRDYENDFLIFPQV